MSCDYGFWCKDCNTEIVVNNMASYSVFDALRSAKELANLHNTLQRLWSSRCDEIRLEAYWCEDINGLIEFCANHREHSLFVIDEYGSTYDAETKERHSPSLKPDE